jgi:hypothetical protein
MQIKNYKFDSEPVLMDYHQFLGCTFHKCRLIYCGFSPVQFDGCRFDDCRWEFSGPAAATLHLLSSFNHLGGEMGKLIVKQALAIINNPPAQPGAPGATGPAPTAATAAVPPPPPAAG